MYISSTIADNIKKIAKLKCISVKKMLEDVELGFNTMSNMKTSMPKADNLARIADYLDCSVDYLLGREKFSAPLTFLTKDESDIINAYRKKTDMQEAVKKLLLDDVPAVEHYAAAAYEGDTEVKKKPKKTVISP